MLEQGNRNNFNSPAQCKSMCMPDSLQDGQVQGVAKKVRAKDDKCLLRKETGLCRAHMPSYYYDAEAEDCYYFVYGGCGV